ncbi:MAG: hypothetical protein IPM64_08835 [Phycisphaerales bacterium]|nr:hypothetical protein [Phycisphaerales bacterium]
MSRLVRWSDIRHQDRALGLIRRALSGGRVPHALLFHGPEGVGKEMAALALAGALLCSRRERGGGAEEALFGEAPPAEIEACGECPPCHCLAAGTHPDFQLVERKLARVHPDAAVRRTKALFLGVDVIRHFVIDATGRRPALSSSRVFVLRDAERMNEEAQNALLKTLEEPPGRAHLILLSSSAERLLPTVRSRCQGIEFGLLPRAFIENELVGPAGLKSEPAAALAALAGGSLGAARRWASAGVAGEVEPIADVLVGVGRSGVEAAAKALLERAEELAPRLHGRDLADESDGVSEGDGDEGADEGGGRSGKSSSASVPTDELRVGVRLVLMICAAVLRDALIVREQADSALLLVAPAARQSAAIAAGMGGGLDEGIRGIAQAEAMLDRNVAPQLCVERFLLTLQGVPLR